jgi:hypothetical protein
MGHCRAQKLLQYTDLALEVVSDMQQQDGRFGQWMLFGDTLVYNRLGS